MNKHIRKMALVGLLAIGLWAGLMAGVWAQEGPKPAVPPGFQLIEGDILVRQSGGLETQATFGDTTFWPGGVVPYDFDANVSAANQALMLAAMAEWEAVAEVDFRAVVTGDQFWLHIQNSTANNSEVGQRPLAEQPQLVNIFNWGNRIIMAHELGHALGLWHEQSRPDRDTYVTINTANVTPPSAVTTNFNIRATADVYPKAEYGLPGDQTYDFDSAMHYGQYFFSSCDPTNGCSGTPKTTIDVRPPFFTTWQSRIGQRDHLSRLDKLIISFLYPQAKWRFVDSHFTGTENGQFQTPYQQFVTGLNNTPKYGTLWIQPGSYPANGTYSQPMTFQAPLGSVQLGQ